MTIIGRIARVVVLALGVTIAGAHSVSTKPRHAASSVRISGRSYTSVAVLKHRFGLKRQWTRSRDTLTLKNAHTSVALAANRADMRINGVQVYGRPVALSKGGDWYVAQHDVDSLFGPILAPPAAARPVRTVVIDPGHGGRDHGNENRHLGLVEKRYTLDVAKRLARLLRAKGLHVVLTRTTDRTLELDDRMAIARRARADLFVSVHFNSFREPGVGGVETFVMTPENVDSAPALEHDRSMRKTRFPGNQFNALNALLGYHVHRSVVGSLKTDDRGLKQFRYYVLRMAGCPAVLVEPAFLSNPGDGRRVKNAAYRQRIASSIATGILAYRDAVAPKRKK